MKGIHIAVISHKRPENVKPLMKLLGVRLSWYVNKGEGQSYINAGAEFVVECGTDICAARNRAIKDAGKNYCIQVSDDLKGIKQVSIQAGKRLQTHITFKLVIADLLQELKKCKLRFGGVAVTTNALNYTGVDYSYDKLVVNDLIIVAPGNYFDANMALKEDYDMSIKELIYTGGVLRADKFLCNFPHRENAGGANTYRDESTEGQATKKLLAKWGRFLKMNPKRPGQVLLNYPLIRQARKELYDHGKKKQV